MLANFFSKSKPVNFILIVILFCIYYTLDILVYRSMELGFEMLLPIPLYLGIFFLFNFIVIKNRLTKDGSYAFLLFTIGLGCLPTLEINPFALFECFLLLLFLRKIYSFRTLNLLKGKLFDSGFWLGCLCTMSPEYGFYFVLILIVLLLFVEISFRTILIPILGFLTPLFLFYTYHFWFDSVGDFYQLFEFQFFPEFESYNNSLYITSLSFFGAITFVSILLRSGKIFSVSNSFKAIWILLLSNLLISLIALFFKEEKDGIALILVLIPATILMANWMQSVQRKNIVTFILLLFIGVSFVVHFIA